MENERDDADENDEKEEATGEVYRELCTFGEGN